MNCTDYLRIRRAVSDWEITATTIYCDYVKDEVTILVSGDETITCTGRQRFTNPNREDARLLTVRAQKNGEQLGCLGDDCTLVTETLKRLSE